MCSSCKDTSLNTSCKSQVVSICKIYKRKKIWKIQIQKMLLNIFKISIPYHDFFAKVSINPLNVFGSQFPSVSQSKSLHVKPEATVLQQNVFVFKVPNGHAAYINLVLI